MAASPRDMRAALHRARLRVTRGLRVAYNPRTDGKPDPGEVVWAWVPYEEDASQGKDRPVLLIGRDRRRLYGLMLTSQDHDRDAADEARHGRYWMDVGAGGWDRERRPSEVRLDRLLTLAPGDVRLLEVLAFAHGWLVEADDTGGVAGDADVGARLRPLTP